MIPLGMQVVNIGAQRSPNRITFDRHASLTDLTQRSAQAFRFGRHSGSAGGVDPGETVALTAHVARAAHEGESNDLNLRRTVFGFSPAFRKIEEEFERTRYGMQKKRLRGLFDAGRARKGIGFDEARPILWMYTSREIYRLLVIDGRMDARPLS